MICVWVLSFFSKKKMGVTVEILILKLKHPQRERERERERESFTFQSRIFHEHYVKVNLKIDDKILQIWDHYDIWRIGWLFHFFQ